MSVRLGDALPRKGVHLTSGQTSAAGAVGCIPARSLLGVPLLVEQWLCFKCASLVCIGTVAMYCLCNVRRIIKINRSGCDSQSRCRKPCEDERVRGRAVEGWGQGNWVGVQPSRSLRDSGHAEPSQPHRPEGYSRIAVVVSLAAPWNDWEFEINI